MKRLLPVALALVAVIPSTQAIADPVTSVSRYEDEEHCFVTTVTVEDDGTSESKTVKCDEYEGAAHHRRGVITSNGTKIAEDQRAEIQKEGSLIAFHQVIGLDPKIKWYPDLRVKALKKFTVGKTFADIFKNTTFLDELSMYRGYKASDFYAFIEKMARELDSGTLNKGIIKDWSYKGVESGDFQYFEVIILFDGTEIKKELAIYVK